MYFRQHSGIKNIIWVAYIFTFKRIVSILFFSFIFIFISLPLYLYFFLKIISRTYKVAVPVAAVATACWPALSPPPPPLFCLLLLFLNCASLAAVSCVKSAKTWLSINTSFSAHRVTESVSRSPPEVEWLPGWRWSGPPRIPPDEWKEAKSLSRRRRETTSDLDEN